MSKPEVKHFEIQSEKGEMKFKSKYHHGLFIKYLTDNEGKYIYITLDTRKPSRSLEQNRLYWLYLNIISEETGHDIEEIHEWAKGKFLSKGIKEIFGDKTRVKKSTTELNKSEFTEFLLDIERVTGVPIPDTSIYETAPLKI